MPFPKNFQATIKSIVRRLFRVYAHLYNHHFAQLCALSIEGELQHSAAQRTERLSITHRTPDLMLMLMPCGGQRTSTRHIAISSFSSPR